MKKFLLILLAFAAFGFAAEPTAKPTTKPTLIFFMNPNGNPCIMQDAILQKAKMDLDKFASIRYVKTTVPTDRDTFYEYGVRSLPQLILVDTKGNPISRFAPGIQEIETIMQALTKK